MSDVVNNANSEVEEKSYKELQSALLLNLRTAQII